jgi:hypothetical protein
MSMKGFLPLLVLLLPAIVPAQENVDEALPAGSNEQTESPATMIDRHKETVDTQIQQASGWVDSFFADPNYEAETATSLVIGSDDTIDSFGDDTDDFRW